MTRILQKSGYEEEHIQKAIAVFDEATEDKKIEIAPGLEVAKWRVQCLEFDMSKAQIIDPLIPIKTAYEFLACHIGSAIYDNVPQLSEIRNSLIGTEINPEAIRVERLSSNKYDPFHGIFFEGNDPYAKVQIRLFGWLAFRVHFLRIAISGTRFVYTHKLDANEEHVDTINVIKYNSDHLKVT